MTEHRKWPISELSEEIRKTKPCVSMVCGWHGVWMLLEGTEAFSKRQYILHSLYFRSDMIFVPQRIAILWTFVVFMTKLRYLPDHDSLQPNQKIKCATLFQTV